MKYLLALSVFFLSLASAMSVTEFSWGERGSLERFLKDNDVPLEILKNLTPNERSLIATIPNKTKGIVLLDGGKLAQAVFPAGEAYQLYIGKKGGNYTIRLLPVSIQTQKRTIAFKIENGFEYDCVKATANTKLSSTVKNILSPLINTNTLKKGESIAIVFNQKIRMGKTSGLPQVLGVVAKRGEQEFAAYLNEKQNKYYDKTGMPLREEFVFAPTPVRNGHITSPFSYARYHPILHYRRPHLGVDYGGNYGTPIYSVANGTVSISGNKGDGFGLQVEIRHKLGFESQYAHLSRIAQGVRVGDVIKKGQLIGYMGSSGLSSGVHLHFGLYRYNKPLNPIVELRRYIDEGMTPEEKSTYLTHVSDMNQKIGIEMARIDPTLFTKSTKSARK